MTATEDTFDFIVVGSGGGSVPAALMMKEHGKSVLIIEKEPQFGGTSAFSGGVIWIPNNDYINAEGAGDSHERSRTYFDTVVGDVGPASTPARRDAYIRYGADMLRFLVKRGMKFHHAHWPDYYDGEPGGLVDGRSLVAPLFNVNELGKWAKKLARSPFTTMVPVGSDEAVRLYTAKNTLKGKILVARIALRIMQNKLLGKEIRGAGNSLQGRLYQIAFREGVELWTDSPVKDFVVEDGRVTGVLAQRNGQTVEVKARLGVLINAGGFARNLAMREAYQPKPTSTDWTMVSPGHTGEMIQTVQKLGAAIDLMDESFWLACSFLPDGTAAGMHSPNDIAKPHCITVDAKGQRFANEANNYMEYGQKMYQAGAVPAWAVFDSRHRKTYLWGMLPPGMTPNSVLENGYLKKADTIEELARICGIDPAGLAATVKRFNGFVAKGVDEDFHRGDSAYNRYFGDPVVKPNPCLGTIEKGPFYAVAIYPGDVGTAGGLVCDENSRVLKEDGSPIPGLYATGISTATVMGRSYLGAGASVGPSMVFGYIAARHAVGANA
jgi:3-oxosteroid 1-dehydrogenase